MKNRGIARGRIFMGGFMLVAAVIVWFTGLWLNPNAPNSTAGVEGVRHTAVTVIRNSAFATLGLSLLSAWFLFGTRRPRNVVLDAALGLVLAVLVGSSLYQLVWLRSAF